MNTPYYKINISLKIRNNYKPYGISRRDLDFILEDFVLEFLVKKINEKTKENLQIEYSNIN
jgi:hypothetical protein